MVQHGSNIRKSESELLLLIKKKIMDKSLATQLSVPNLSEGGSISKHYFLDLPEGHLFVHRLLVNNAFYYS